MARRFTRDKNQKAHERLESWASWIIRYVESSALDAKIVNYSPDRSGGPAGPIIPDVMKPPEVLRTEQAYLSQSALVRRNIECYYGVIRKDSPLYVKVTKSQREHFLNRIARMLYP